MPRPPDVADLFRQPLIDPPHTLSVLACRSSKAQADAGARYRNLKATMKYALAFVLLILSACGGGGAAKHADPTGHTAASPPISTGPTAGPRAKPPALSPATLSYDGPTGSGRFGRVTIVHEGRAVRTLLGQQDQDGAFEREKSPRLSPDHRFVFISQIASAELDTPQGPITQETAYCNLVDTHSGCIVARETGEFCTVKGKAFLYPEPNSRNTPKSYLIKGDMVSVEDATSGWCKIRFQAKAKPILKWMDCDLLKLK